MKEDSMIHVAVIHTKPDRPEDLETLYFVSLDGEKYLPVNRPPNEGEEDAIALLFEPDGRGALHMTWARRCFNLGSNWFGDWVESVDQYTV